MTPPRGAIFVGQGDYHEQGRQQKEELINYAGLSPQSQVLDIGCGIGRLATSLTQYLDAEGGYTGFDIVKEGIEWCQKNISSRYPNFRFIHVDLNNALYNTATKQAKDFQFPFEQGAFDVVVLYSVATHMLEHDMAHYLEQIERVLRPSGVCLCSFFLIDEDSRERMQAKRTDMQFSEHEDGLFYMDYRLKEGNVGFPVEKVWQLCRATGLDVKDIIRGRWRGDEVPPNYQDLVIMTKQET